MRIKKISSNEVSVYMTNQELESFDFQMDNGVPRKECLHNFLFNIMEIVKNETGFDPYNGGRVIVEAINSPQGMKLLISKMGGKKLTREQFNRVKNVRVKEPELSVSAYTELVKIMNELGKKSVTEKKNRFSFVFDRFGAMEEALCTMKSEDVQKCILYRSGMRYAIVAETKRNDRLYNILSEFSVINSGGTVLAEDINEGWKEIARGEKLIEMADAVRNMQ